MNGLIENIIMVSLQMAVLVPVTMLFRTVFKKTNKIFSYIMWLVILLRLCIPIQIESPYGILDFNRSEYTEKVDMNQPGDDSKTDSHSSSYVYEGGMDESIIIITPDGIVTPPEKQDTISDTNQIKFSFTPEQVLLMVWMAGVAVMSVISVTQLARLKRKIALAISVEGNVWETDGISTAFVMGIIRPRIFIPVGITGKEREFILRHERMHIKHKDHIVRVVMLVVNIIYWWNPMVWLAVHFMKKDMEMLCDECVVKNMETDTKKDYLVTLLNNSAIKSGIVPIMTFGESNTEMRIKHIMNLKRPKLYCYLLILIFMILCCFGCVVKQDKIDKDILSDFTISEEQGLEDNTNKDNTDKNNANNSENNTTENNSATTEFEEETIYEEWLALNLPSWGRKMKYPQNDTTNSTITVEPNVSSEGVGLDLGMLFFVNGIPQRCIDDSGNVGYLSKYYVGAGETIKKDFICEFNNVQKSDKYVCRGAMMTSPNVIKTNKHSVALGFLQDVRECGVTEIECQNNSAVDVDLLEEKKISKEESQSNTNSFLVQAFDGKYNSSNVLERKTAMGEYMLELTPQSDASYIISFWGNGEPVQVGEHMYYHIDLEEGDKYQFIFNLDEKLVNSIDNFYAIAAPVGLEGEIDKTDTVIFIDEYGK